MDFLLKPENFKTAVRADWKPDQKNGQHQHPAARVAQRWRSRKSRNNHMPARPSEIWTKIVGSNGNPLWLSLQSGPPLNEIAKLGAT